MKPKLIYVVMGTTGEYSDRSEWAVVAYQDKALAEEHVKLADKRAKEIQAVTEMYHTPRESNQYDPGFHMDYTGTGYFINEVELRKALPK